MAELLPEGEMRPFPPTLFVAHWPESLRPIDFPSPCPNLPTDCLALLAEFGLPRRLLIRCYNDIMLTFTGTATPLATIWERDLQKGYKLGDMPETWARYWHLADQHYLQGGGWICVEEITGRLVVIDLDIPSPVYLLNASVQHFYTTLAYLLEWTERTGGDSIAIPGLRDSLLNQSVVPPDELEPFWMNIVYATIDCGDPTDLRVELLA